MEKTFVMVKPDGVERGLTSEILKRFEQKGFTLLGAKLLKLSEELAKEHYEEHKDRSFFESLVTFITSGPVFAMVLEGEGVIAEARKMIGATDPLEAAPGTIRGDLAVLKNKNVVHGSDSLESANREISLYFHEDELIESSVKENV